METQLIERREHFGMTDLQTMAKALTQSKVNCYTQPQILSLLLISQADGLHPMKGLARYDIIQDKKTGNIKIEKKSYAMLGEFKDKGGKVRWIERTDKIASAEFIEPNGIATEFEYTEGEAITAGMLDKNGRAPDWSNWTKRKGTMLITKLLKKALRIIDPDSGLGDFGHDSEVEVVRGPPQNITPPKEPIPLSTTFDRPDPPVTGMRASPQFRQPEPIEAIAEEVAKEAAPISSVKEAPQWMADKLDILRRYVDKADMISPDK